MDLNIGEAQLIVAISEAVEGERVHIEVPYLTARILALASGGHPHAVDYLLHRLGVVPVQGYQRSTAELLAAIEEVLPLALTVIEEYRAQLLEDGISGPDAHTHTHAPDSIGTVVLGDWTFAP